MEIFSSWLQLQWLQENIYPSLSLSDFLKISNTASAQGEAFTSVEINGLSLFYLAFYFQ